MKLLKKHLFWFLDRMDRDRLDSTAAHGAFFLLISFLPFVAFLLTLMQRIHFSDGVSLIEAALGALPDSVAAYLESLLPSALESTGVLPVAVITAVWSSSMGMVAVIKGLDQIYGAKEPRGYVRLRAMAVLCVVVFAAALIVAAALVVLELLPHPLQVFRAGGQGLQVGLGLPLGDARLFQGAFRQALGPQGRGAQHPGALLPGKAQPLPAEQGGLVGQAQLHHLAQGVRQGKGQGPGDFLQGGVLFLFPALGPPQGVVQAVEVGRPEEPLPGGGGLGPQPGVGGHVAQGGGHQVQGLGRPPCL